MSKKIVEIDDEDDLFEEPTRPGRGGKKPSGFAAAKAPAASANASLWTRLVSSIGSVHSSWSDKLFPRVLDSFHYVGGWAWVAFTGLLVLAAPLAIADQRAYAFNELVQQHEKAQQEQQQPQ